jgi:hypothetical protein
MMAKEQLYKDVAAALNHDFRTVLHADANMAGISIAPLCSLSLRHLAANVEVSRALAGKHLIVTVTDCGIICVQ